MHILFVTLYYPPEVGGAQTYISETAARLVKRGHRVTVLTTLPNYPSGVVPPEYRRGARRREERDGVAIVRVWSYISPRKGFLRRVLTQLSFGCLAPFLGGRAVGQPDIIIVVSPPLFTAIAGRMLAWRKRCPYMFNVLDIWPEAAVQLGILRNRALIWLAERLEWSTYRRACAIWAVTAGIYHTLIQRGVPPERVFMLPVGADTALFRPLPKAQARAELGWDERFTVLHAGTIALAHGLATLLDAAAQLSSYPDIRIVLVGEGATATSAELKAEAERRGLRNITFMGPQPHEQMPLIIAGADVCLVSVRRLPLFQGALPVKMFEAMACARPILLAADGEPRRLAEREAGAAVYVEPEDPVALAKAILDLRDRPDLAEQLGKLGRAFIERHFDRGHLTAMLDARIAALLGVPQATTLENPPVPVTMADKP